jgi:hypothetical protein
LVHCARYPQYFQSFCSAFIAQGDPSYDQQPSNQQQIFFTTHRETVSMPQTEIPYLFMRGGTSRGPFFKRDDLPEDRDQLSEILIAAVGAGHPLNINGIGGGAAVTTKVVMLSPSTEEDADIDYFFA